ncbi:MAG: single-stranded DNA-binding protein [Longimicrobiales bacterium]
MARSLNKVMLIGNIGSEPEIKTTGAGTKFAKVSLATNRQFKDRQGQQQEKTEWHRLTFWDKLAELVEQYVKKGDRIYVEGRIEYSTTEDDKGNQKFWTDITVNEMVLLGGASGGAGGGGGGYEGGGASRGRQTGGGGGYTKSGPGSTSGGGGGSTSPFDSQDDDLPF